MQATIQTIRAYDKNVHGCVRTQRDVMISLIPNESNDIHDFFLTQDQAEDLYLELTKVLVRNLQDTLSHESTDLEFQATPPQPCNPNVTASSKHLSMSQ